MNGNYGRTNDGTNERITGNCVLCNRETNDGERDGFVTYNHGRSLLCRDDNAVMRTYNKMNGSRANDDKMGNVIATVARCWWFSVIVVTVVLVVITVAPMFTTFTNEIAMLTNMFGGN